MSISRRQFLLASSTSLALPSLLRAQSNSQPQFELTASQSELQIAPVGYPTSEIWSFNASSPGPLLRMRQGEETSILVKNTLPEPTSVHWHGLRIANAMDGAAPLTQDPISPQSEQLYSFTPPDAGTFWYHAHWRSNWQVGRGLYGAIIVEESEPPKMDHDILVVLDDWLMDENGTLVPVFDNLMQQAHGGILGNYVTAKFAPARPALKSGDRLRLRLLNAATDRVMELQISGANSQLAALDGMPLQELRSFESLTLSPGSRADLFMDVSAQDGERIDFSLLQGGEAMPFAALDISGQNTETSRPELQPLPTNDVPTPDLETAKTIPLKMQGGAMAMTADGGFFEGEKLSTQELTERGQVWMFNGQAGMGDDPLAKLKSGESLRLVLENETAFDHSIHLHGHHFYELNSGGELGDLRDTTLVRAGETREIAFQADNIGRWMLHCHMLSHQASGMATWIEVA